MYSEKLNLIGYHIFFIILIILESIAIVVSYTLVFKKYLKLQHKIKSINRTPQLHSKEKYSIAVKLLHMILIHMVSWLATLVQMLLSLCDIVTPLSYQEFTSIFFSPCIAIANPVFQSKYLLKKCQNIVRVVFGKNKIDKPLYEIPLSGL